MNYAKLSPKFWNSKIGRAARAIGPQGLQVYLYLRSCESANYIGLFTLNLGYASLDLDITEEVLTDYIQKFEDAGLVKFDATKDLLWVIDHAEMQIGELTMGDKQIVCINKTIATIERCAIRDDFFIKYHKPLKLNSDLGPTQWASEQHVTTIDGETRHKASSSSLAQATTTGHIQGALDVLQLMREANRATYSEQSDGIMRENAELIGERTSGALHIQILQEAIVNGDLDLSSALERVGLRNI